MPTCPICNAKIDFLISWCYEYHAYKFVLKGNWYDYELLDYRLPSEENETYECPRCNHILFDTAESAYEFLKGSKEEGNADQERL